MSTQLAGDCFAALAMTGTFDIGRISGPGSRNVFPKTGNAKLGRHGLTWSGHPRLPSGNADVDARDTPRHDEVRATSRGPYSRVAAIRNSRLPSGPVIGLSVRPSTRH